jgi:hypothetical protein
MAKDPNARYRDADEMIRAVEGEKVPPVAAVAAVDESTQPMGADATVLGVGLPTEVLAPMPATAAAPPRAVVPSAPGGRPPGMGARKVALIVVAAAVLGIGVALANLGDDPAGVLPVRTTNPVTTQPAATAPPVTTAPTVAPTTVPPNDEKPGKGQDKKNQDEDD